MTTDSHLRRGVQKSAFRRYTFESLRSPGFLGKSRLIGLTLFLLGTVVFSFLAYNVKPGGAFVQWDTTTANALQAAAKSIPGSLVEYVLFGFFLGKELVITLGTILAVYFLYKRFWRELAMVLIGLGGGGLIWYFLSHYFDRPRPPTQLDVLVLRDPAFPSGLALAAVLCYGLLGYLLVPRMPSRFWKWFVVILLTLIIVFVGASGLLLGAHYVTDVIAGYALGLAWAGLVYTLLEKFFPEAAAQNKVGPSMGI
jgi:undecaprenyl-diphosphatase